MNILLYLSVQLTILLLTADALLEIESSDVTINGSFTIVNVHKHLQDLWQDRVAFDGMIEKGIMGESEYYNISNFIFFDMTDTTYLFLEGYLDVVAVQDLGAEFIVIREKLDPPGRRYIFNRFREGIEIPVVAIEAGLAEDFYLALNTSVGTSISLTAVPDINTWTAFKPVIVGFNIMLVVLSVIPIAVALYKMYKFQAAGQCTMSISLICLSLNLIGGILNTAGVIIDPYNLTSMDQYVLGAMLLVYPFFFLVSSGLLITFYWAEILNDKSTNISSFLGSFKVPFYATIIVLFVINVSFIILPQVIPDFDVQFIVVLVYFLTILFTGIFYVVVGSRIYKKIMQLSKPSAVTKLIIAAGIWIIILTIILLAFVIVSVTIEWQYPFLDLTIFNLFWISRFGISSIFSYIFNPQSRKKSHGTKSGSRAKSGTIRTKD